MEEAMVVAVEMAAGVEMVAVAAARVAMAEVRVDGNSPEGMAAAAAWAAAVALAVAEKVVARVVVVAKARGAAVRAAVAGG